MNAMKGLLLGTAAGLVAMSSAQAADLPVKAKPVEYVKVCSLYGAGFFYVPGTDTCLKIGMYLRSDHGYGQGGNVNGVYQSAAIGTRNGQDMYSYRARINLTTDWRTQSDYGVIRAYAAIIAQQGTGDVNFIGGATSTGNAGILRAFIQFAGFTFGHAVSYFDFFNGADYGYMASINGSTGVNGIDLIAYTWQLGNGVSISVDLEDGGTGATGARTKNVVNASLAAQLGTTAAGATITSSAERAWSPDIAGNIRIDQAWGSAQISGALHNASGGYYAGTGTTNPATTTQVTTNGHPGDVWGWAISGGFRLQNFLMPKDRIEMAYTYAKGAAGYTAGLPAVFAYGGGNSVAQAYVVDGVYTTGNSIELTETWKFELGYEHFWNAQWRTSIYAQWTGASYNNTARSYLCGTGTNSVGATLYGTTTALSNCSPNSSQNALTTRTAWNPHPSLEIGLDLIWWHQNTANAGTATLLANGARPAGTYVIEDQDKYVAVLRVQKTILP